jgi:hypothetical protein
VDNSTQAFWLDEITLMQSEFDKVFFMKVVGNCLILPPSIFQSIWITIDQDMAKILSSSFCGRGGYLSSFCLDEMSLLTSELEQVVRMKVVVNCLIFPPTKFNVFCLLELQLWVNFRVMFWLDCRTDSDFSFVAKL